MPSILLFQVAWAETCPSLDPVGLAEPEASKTLEAVVLGVEHYSADACAAGAGADADVDAAVVGVEATATVEEAYFVTSMTGHVEVAEEPQSLVELKLVDRTVNSCLDSAEPEPTDRFPFASVVDLRRVRPLN